MFLNKNFLRTNLLLAILLAGSQVLYGQPKIVANKTDVCLRTLTDGTLRSDNVAYTLTNCTGCTDMEWDVGAGFFFTGNPVYVTSYTTTGAKTVKCRFKTVSGSSATITQTNIITVRGIPSANVSYSSTSICDPSKDSVTFTDISPSSVSRSWLINGINIPNGKKAVTLGFAANQSLAVYMSISDVYGCTNNYFKDSAVLVGSTVTGSIQASQTQGCAPKLVNLNALLDTGYQSIKTYAWSFQNASPATSSKAKPTYINFFKADTNDVALTVTTNIGCVFSFKANNLINLGDSTTLNIITPAITNVCANKQLTVYNTNSKTGNPSWSITNVQFKIDSTVGKKLYFRILDTGVANIQVYESINGCYSSTLKTNALVVKGPKAGFTADVGSYCSAPDTLKFTNTSIKPPGVTNWQWDIYEQGVGRVSGGISQNFSYITNKLAKYDVRLIASGGTGCKDTLFLTNASVGGPMKAGFKTSPHPACPSQLVALIDATENKRLGLNHNYKWTFYNANGTIKSTSTLLKPKESYAKEGRYSAKLVISNNKGCKDSVTLADTIFVKRATVQLSCEDSTICVFENTKYYAHRTPFSESVSTYWLFKNLDQGGDPIVRLGDSVTVAPGTAGRWSVEYFISDTSGGGCVSQFKFPFLLKVSGHKTSFTSTPKFGCEPLNISLSGTVTKIYDYDNPSSKPLTYKWVSFRNSPITFANPNSLNTTAVVQKGRHYPYLVVTSASGCKDSFVGTEITSGVFANYQIYSSSRCMRTPLTTKNESVPWATGFEYICDSSSVKFLPNRFVKEPNIVFTQPGLFKISLVAKFASCTDTWSNVYSIEEVKADFTSADSVSFCAPKVVNFKNLSKGNIVKNTWSFGDGNSGVSSALNPIGNLYTRNKPLPGFDVQLITTNRNGCSDTLKKIGFVKIIGPVPEIALKNFTGCEPLTVEFENKSSFYSKFFLDFADGSFIDSTKIANHTYRIQNSSLIKQRFVPSILLYDDNNCAALAFAKDTIEVLKQPKASFLFSSTRFQRPGIYKGCADDNFLVQFNNTSQFFNKTSWDLDGDGNIDVNDLNNPSFFYRTPGSFNPQIIATYLNGCSDTFVGDTIIALPAPEANFRVKHDSICIKAPAEFINTTQSNEPLVKFVWDFGEPDYFDDSSVLENPKYKYKTPNVHLINFFVQDINGCKDQVVKSMFIADTSGPRPTPIAFITVNNDNTITLNWLSSKAKNYYNYKVFDENATPSLQIEKYNIKDTVFNTFKGNSVNTNRYCLTVQIEDTCGHKGVKAGAHCTILLNAKSTKKYHNELTWLSYEYWESQLHHYEVWRKAVDETAFSKIADINPNSITSQSFIDSFLCNKEYCYFVKAIHNNRKYESQSNIACSTPIYAAPDKTVPVELVTVAKDSFVDVYWAKYPEYIRGGKYNLERAIYGTSSYSSIGITPNLYLRDKSAQVHKNSYNYRVKFVDQCGVKGSPGTFSNSILLSSPSLSGVVNVNWSPYSWWHSGVRDYKVQYKNATGTFQDYVIVPATIVQLTNVDIGKFNLDSVCMRVIATKDTAALQESYSNINCFIDKSVLWVPTAFSPNSDGKNDVFSIVSRNIRGAESDPSLRFQCQIYNRWGQKVYETYDIKAVWNGTYMGKMVESGLYVVKVFAVGYDGQAFRYNGTLSIQL